jgi:hypothetical protein
MGGVMQIEPAGTWPGATRPARPPAAWPIIPRWPATPMAGWSCSPGRTARCQTGRRRRLVRLTRLLSGRTGSVFLRVVQCFLVAALAWGARGKGPPAEADRVEQAAGAAG